MGGRKPSGSNDDKSCCLVEYIDALSMIKQGKLKFRKDMKPSTRESIGLHTNILSTWILMITIGKRDKINGGGKGRN